MLELFTRLGLPLTVDGREELHTGPAAEFLNRLNCMKSKEI